MVHFLTLRVMPLHNTAGNFYITFSPSLVSTYCYIGGSHFTLYRKSITDISILKSSANGLDSSLSIIYYNACFLMCVCVCVCVCV